MPPTAKALAKNLERMRAIAIALPEATEEVTWGTEINFRVRRKIFAFPGDGDRLTVKADRAEFPAVVADPRFRPAPYLARSGLGSLGDFRLWRSSPPSGTIRR